MGDRGKYTREEISSQPEAWKQALKVLQVYEEQVREFSQLAMYQQVLFTGCGSTYYLSLAAAAIFQEMTGLRSRGLPASELWLSPQTWYNSAEDTLLVSISRSGETSETINACEAFNENSRGKIITLVCQSNSRLNRIGSLNLVFPSGMEQSIAQTRAFSTLFLGVIGLGVIWTGQDIHGDCLEGLSLVGKRLIEDYWPVAQRYGNNLDFDRFYFLGSGTRYGLACELNLKMKEMSLTHSEAFHFLEFRHGPKAMVNKQTLIVGLVSEENARYEQAVLSDMHNLGAEIVTIGEQGTEILFNSGLEEVRRNVLYLPFGQMMAFERAMAKGLDPDHPHNLDSVVMLTQ